MHKGIRIGGSVLGGVCLLGAGAMAFLWLKSPDSRPPSTEVVERTPERVERGRYLVHHVTGCLDCHSTRNWNFFSGPLKPGTWGQGGETFDEKLGVPGRVTAQNITPDPGTGIGSWTDGEILRAFREGVRPDGEALFPMMPYEFYREMSDEDARAVVAYLRQMNPIHRTNPPREIRFPVNLFIKFTPRPATGPQETPTEPKAYGKYLTTIAGCLECHTPRDGRGGRLAGREGAGGWVMKGSWGTVVTPNITPHEDTYVGQATREEFIGRFKAFADNNRLPEAEPGKNTVMGWFAYGGMTESDLGAIYDYLKTLEPIPPARTPPAIAQP